MWTKVLREEQILNFCSYNTLHRQNFIHQIYEPIPDEACLRRKWGGGVLPPLLMKNMTCDSNE